MWALGTDPRVKAIVAHFGISWIEYYRNNQVWMYDVPYVEPPKSPGEEILLAGMAPEAYVPYISSVIPLLIAPRRQYSRALDCRCRFLSWFGVRN
jgi:hypothetical protein